MLITKEFFVAFLYFDFALLSSALLVREGKFFPLSLTRFFIAFADFLTTRFPTVFAPDTAVFAFLAYFAPFCTAFELLVTLEIALPAFPT